jgi:hypothetical protein
MYYNKNKFIIKDKNPPNMKNGANGMNFWFCFRAHIAPDMPDIISASAKPPVPNHKPPIDISFMSPMPIGVSEFLLRRCMALSKINPSNADVMYPNVAPAIPVLMSNGKLYIPDVINPININGNKYASGIILWR